jgi:hypothetical protein
VAARKGPRQSAADTGSTGERHAAREQPPDPRAQRAGAVSELDDLHSRIP